MLPSVYEKDLQNRTAHENGKKQRGQPDDDVEEIDKASHSRALADLSPQSTHSCAGFFLVRFITEDVDQHRLQEKL